MKHVIRVVEACALVGLSLVLAACQSSAPLSPASPTNSAAGDITAPSTTGATISGTIAGVSTASARTSRAASTSSDVTVSIVGTNISTVVGADGSFTLTGVPPIDIVLRFGGPGTDATLSLGPIAGNDQWGVTVTLNASTATLEDLTRIITGTVTSVSGSCPALTLTMGDTTVKTSSETMFGGKNCADIKVGDTGGAKGKKQSDGSLLASYVWFLGTATPPPPVTTPPPTTPPPSTPPPSTEEVVVTGKVNSLSGACPTLTVMLGDATLKTSASTMFGGKACADIEVGNSGGGKGTRQGDGSILASYVSFSPTTAPPVSVTLSGTVKAVSGACPALTFTVNDATVRTSAGTTFNSEACSAIKVGDAATVKGTRQSDNSVLATLVEAAPPVTAPFVLTGTVTSMDGTCPALTLVFGDATVKTNAATIFGGQACTAIVVGAKGGAQVTRQSDGSLLASYVSSVSPTAK